MNNLIYKYVIKYSIMLAALHLLVQANEYVLRYLEVDIDYNSISFIAISTIPFLLTIFLNLMIAWMLYRDIRKLSLPTRYVIIATVFFSAIGVCAFLLYLIYEKTRPTQVETAERTG